MKPVKYKISDNQWNTLRLIYAMMIATKHYTFNADHLLNAKEIYVNPKWLKQIDVLGRDNKKQWEDWLGLIEGDEAQRGFLKFKRTKKGFNVSVNLARLGYKK